MGDQALVSDGREEPVPVRSPEGFTVEEIDLSGGLADAVTIRQYREQYAGDVARSLVSTFRWSVFACLAVLVLVMGAGVYLDWASDHAPPKNKGGGSRTVTISPFMLQPPASPATLPSAPLYLIPSPSEPSQERKSSAHELGEVYARSITVTAAALASLFGPFLGFVLGYYFRSQREGNAR